MKRIQLKLSAESEEQEQVLAEFKLKREMQRTKLSKIASYLSSFVCITFMLMCKPEQESQKNIQEYSQKLEEMTRSHDLEVESLEHESQIKREDEEVSCG